MPYWFDAVKRGIIPAKGNVLVSLIKLCSVTLSSSRLGAKT